MGIEDKDFVMRQVRQLAEGLGALLSKNSLKELINFDQSEDNAHLTDTEIESIILVVDINNKAKKWNFSDQQVADKLKISLEDWKIISNGGRLPTLLERETMENFISN